MRNGLYVQEEWVDRNFLASTYVGTPDPRQDHPPRGERLLIGWDFPRSVFQQELSLYVVVRFWNCQEESYSLPLKRKRGNHVLNFPNQQILTYRVEAISKNGKIVSTWEHQFWTKLIEIGSNES